MRDRFDYGQNPDKTRGGELISCYECDHLAKIAEAEHAKGNPFQVGIFTGASIGESCDGVLSRAKAIRYRAPYTLSLIHI